MAAKDMETTQVRAFLNDFAIRCFRDTADGDYIAARMAYRAQLMPQFLWACLQAIEKYLKCILLLNRIKSDQATHDLTACLQKIEASAKFKMHLSDFTHKFIVYLDRYGRFRYFEVPYYVMGQEIWLLDQAVWEIRRYCTVLDYSTPTADGGQVSRLERELKRIARSESVSPQKFVLSDGGKLENIIRDKKHRAREALIWNNGYFGNRIRKKLVMHATMHSANSPLSLHPEMLDEVTKYVYVPKDVKREYRNIVIKRRTVEN
jgi:HEPN domain-containing protein